MKKLSVIVPVYNMASGDKLAWCMDSLTSQTLEDMEILAVDDCSTDESLQVLKDYEMKYPDRVRVFSTDRNCRQGGAKNVGLQHAQGEWIGFIDADDWVCRDYYERLLKKAEETGADVVGTDYSLVDRHTWEPGKTVHNNRPEQAGVLDGDTAAQARRRSLMVDFGSLVVKIYRREIVVACESRFPEDMFYEDNAIARTWVSRMRHFEYIPEPMYYYFQHADSTVHTVSMSRLEDRVRAGLMMLSEAEKYGYKEEFGPELEYSFTVLFYKNTLFSAMREYHGRGKYRFVTSLARQMKEIYPDFAQNRYYLERTDEEEKRMMRLQMRSPLLFYLCYQALWLYRDIRYKK